MYKFIKEENKINLVNKKETTHGKETNLKKNTIIIRENIVIRDTSRQLSTITTGSNHIGKIVRV